MASLGASTDSTFALVSLCLSCFPPSPLSLVLGLISDSILYFFIHQTVVKYLLGPIPTQCHIRSHLIRAEEGMISPFKDV